MKRWCAGLVMFAAIIGIAAPVSAQTIGVVLMHGNTDSPSGSIARLAAAMESAGYLVERPEMCWSYRRRRDRPFLDCLKELEAPIARLTARGARAIVVAGMSQGGIAALAFGARHPDLAGIIALAPAGAPERLVAVFPDIAQSVAKARAMVAAGRGNQRASFSDRNIRGPFPVDTTAAIYLSFFDPDGPANMLENTSRLHEPLLWVAGTADRSQSGTGYEFSRAPANPLNRYITVNADHLGTPNAAIEAVLAWLRELR
ncbi:MAG TPA: alpha/beta fold hydrolase [Stellaceae bacterium]|nr:alpha/beta fold hydrolase [Stellaceae bacterium]